MNKTTALVEQDENRDQFLQIPQDILDSLGWNEETELKWSIREDGSIILEKHLGDE